MDIRLICGTFCVVAGIPFFFSGTIGLLRFPDIYSRLHALTKADNIGLGLIVLGLSLQADNWAIVARLILIWLIVLGASSASCHLVARTAIKRGVIPWKKA